MAYTAGAAQVAVTPDFRGFHRAIGDELKKEDASFTKAGDRWGKLAADGFKARFKAADMPTARIKTEADTAKANAEIDKAARNRKSKISVDVSWLKSPLTLGALGAAALGPQALGLGLAGAGLGAAFGSAAVASVAFGAVAKGAISKVTEAQKKLTAAQQQYAKATTKAGRASALRAEQQATAGLTASEKKLSTELTGLSSAWTRVQHAQEPVVTGALLPWFAAARSALRFISPLVIDSADSIKLLGSETNRALQNPFWDRFTATVGISATGAITNFGRAAGHVFSGLAHLFVTFAPDINKLPPLVDRAAAAFDRWASKVSRSGLDQFFAKTFSHGNVQTLKGDLSALGSTLGNIAKATANISPAAFLGLSKVLEILSRLSPGQIEALAVIYGITKTTGGLGNLGKLATGLGSLGGGKKLTPGASRALTGAGTAIAAIPIAGAVISGLKGTSSGPGGKNWWDNPFGMAGPQQKGSANNWLTSWAPYERIFTTDLPKAWSISYQAFQVEFAGKITSWFSTSLPHFFTAGIPMGWSAAYQGFQRDFAGKITSWFTQSLPHFFGSAGMLLTGAGRALAGGLSAGWNASAGAVSGAFRGAYRWATGQTRDAGNWLRGAGVSAGRGLAAGWNTTYGAVAGAFRRAYGWATGQLRDAGGWLRGAGNAAARGLVSGWDAASGAVAGAARRAYGWVTGAFRGAGGWLVGAGESIMHGLAAGLNAAIGSVKSILNWVTAHIPSWKGPPSVDRALLKPAGTMIMGGLAGSLAAGIPGVRSTMQSATAAIAAGLNVPSVAFPATPRVRGGDGVNVNLTYTGPQSGIVAAVVRDLRADIQNKAGGNVQAHLGQGRVR